METGPMALTWLGSGRVQSILPDPQSPLCASEALPSSQLAAGLQAPPPCPAPPSRRQAPRVQVQGPAWDRVPSTALLRKTPHSRLNRPSA